MSFHPTPVLVKHTTPHSYIRLKMQHLMYIPTYLSAVFSKTPPLNFWYIYSSWNSLCLSQIGNNTKPVIQHRNFQSLHIMFHDGQEIPKYGQIDWWNKQTMTSTCSWDINRSVEQAPAQHLFSLHTSLFRWGNGYIIHGMGWTTHSNNIRCTHIHTA